MSEATEPKHKIFDLIAAKTNLTYTKSSKIFVLGWITSASYSSTDGWKYTVDWSDGFVDKAHYQETNITRLKDDLKTYINNLYIYMDGF
jgi:hypothetical protein